MTIVEMIDDYNQLLQPGMWHRVMYHLPHNAWHDYDETQFWVPVEMRFGECWMGKPIIEACPNLWVQHTFGPNPHYYPRFEFCMNPPRNTRYPKIEQALKEKVSTWSNHPLNS